MIANGALSLAFLKRGRCRHGGRGAHALLALQGAVGMAAQGEGGRRSALSWAERRAQQALLGYVSACGLLFVQKERASRLSPHPHDALP